MVEQDPNYLATIRANNPSLTDYWPGARRRRKTRQPDEPAEPGENETKGSDIKAGCLPCSIGHMGTCSGLLKEAVRFAQSDGVNSDIPIDRINTCLDELNALERKDLTPELIETLPDWEKELALKALEASRGLRHSLESIQTLDDLIHATANTTRVRMEIGREWFRNKLATMNPQEKQKLAEKVIQRLEEVKDT